MSAHPPARHGLVAGTFLPPTASDVLLVARAADACERLTVAVVSGPDDGIDGHVRAGWMREIVAEAAPGARVVHVTGEGEEQGAGWVSRLGEAPVDALFTRADDADGDALAGGLMAGLDGIRRVAVEPAPGAPTAADVRADPMRFWEAIPVPVRPHFVRRVRLFGPESTGKSDVAEALAARFATAWAPEYARELYERLGYHFDYEDVARVVTGQLEAEESAARAANRVLLCDTDPLTTLIYARHYFGRAPRFLERLVAERRYAATLLFNLDVPWTPDPQRDSPAVRAHLFGVFRDELASRRVPYALVGGTGAARVEAAARAVEAVLGA